MQNLIRQIFILITTTGGYTQGFYKNNYNEKRYYRPKRINCKKIR